MNSPKSKSPLLFWSLTSALAGFLFGFDTVVISGAEQRIQALWNLSGALHGLALAAALYGTVLGSLIGGWPTERFGRRKTLIGIGLLYLVSAIWSALAADVGSFTVARFLGGLGVGISTVASPLYISEISPPDRRGRLAGMFQFNIVFGILVAFLSNFIIGNLLGESAWRWMLGVEAVPAVLYTVLCLRLPESPRWLIRNGRREEGIEVLGRVDPSAGKEELGRLADAIEDTGAGASRPSGFWSPRWKIPILLAVLIAVFNQLSGINVILYFAPRLLDLAGLQNPLLAAVCIGVTNLVFTLLGLYLIDRIGRRTLLTIGSFGYIVSLGVCAGAFLSFSGFQVVSKSIDLAVAAEAVQQIDAGEKRLIPEDEAAQRDAYAGAKAALVAATEGGGNPVEIPETAGTEEVLQVALSAKAAASEDLGAMSGVVLLCLLAFIAAHAVGQGAVIWVFIGEIFPNHLRAPGQSLGCFTHWIFAASLTQLFPIAIGRFDAGYIFLFFCLMMVLQLVWVKTMVPETKGVPLEEMNQRLGIGA